MIFCSSILTSSYEKFVANPISISNEDKTTKVDEECVCLYNCKAIFQQLNFLLQIFFPAITFVGDFIFEFDRFADVTMFSAMTLLFLQSMRKESNNKYMSNDQKGLE